MWRLRSGGILHAHIGDFWLIVREADGMARFLVLRAASNGRTRAVAFLGCGAESDRCAAMHGAEAMVAECARRSLSSLGSHLKSALVLLIEDDVLLRRSWADLLSEAGLRVIAVSSAAEALQLPDGINEPAILVADVHGPGPDGIRLVIAIRQRWPLIRAVLAREAAAPATDLLAPGDILLVRPFLDSELLEAVRHEDARAPGWLLSHVFLPA